MARKKDQYYLSVCLSRGQLARARKRVFDLELEVGSLYLSVLGTSEGKSVPVWLGSTPSLHRGVWVYCLHATT